MIRLKVISSATRITLEKKVNDFLTNYEIREVISVNVTDSVNGFTYYLTYKAT